jgi:hypothetical protein
MAAYIGLVANALSIAVTIKRASGSITLTMIIHFTGTLIGNGSGRERMEGSDGQGRDNLWSIGQRRNVVRKL